MKMTMVRKVAIKSFARVQVVGGRKEGCLLPSQVSFRWWSPSLSSSLCYGKFLNEKRNARHAQESDKVNFREEKRRHIHTHTHIHSRMKKEKEEDMSGEIWA